MVQKEQDLSIYFIKQTYSKQSVLNSWKEEHTHTRRKNQLEYGEKIVTFLPEIQRYTISVYHKEMDNTLNILPNNLAVFCSNFTMLLNKHIQIQKYSKLETNVI